MLVDIGIGLTIIGLLITLLMSMYLSHSKRRILRKDIEKHN